jgi:hypothetical protein
MALSDYFLHHRDVIPVSPSGRAEHRSRPRLLPRLLDALVASRLQQTEHEIARYLESTGGKLTDTVEREIAVRDVLDVARARGLHRHRGSGVADTARLPLEGLSAFGGGRKE